MQEALSPTATHDTVRQQFKQFGNVAYVSLPKFRTSGRIKEFGFVEFEDKSSVTKCLNAFHQFDGVIGDSLPENLKSVVAYMKEKDEEDELLAMKCKELEKEEENQKSQTKTNEGETQEETAAETSAEIQKTQEKDESDSNIEKKELENEPKPETKVEAKTETKVEETTEVKESNEHPSDDQLPKNTNKRVNEEPLSVNENPPAKRLKAQVSEDQQDQDDQGNTTDEKASVTDENQDQKPQK